MRLAICIALFIGLTSFGCRQTEPQFKAGDIVFQDSESNQSKAIKYATQSNFSHCGIILPHDGKLEVFEAVQPVKWTPIEQWIASGKEGNYSIKRSSLSTQQIDGMAKIAAPLEGKNYDIQFNWTDDKMYCSELVWKIYQRGAGIELCKLRPLKDYRLDAKLVQQQLQRRYGSTIPLDEMMVSPEDLFKSEKLK